MTRSGRKSRRKDPLIIKEQRGEVSAKETGWQPVRSKKVHGASKPKRKKFPGREWPVVSNVAEMLSKMKTQEVITGIIERKAMGDLTRAYSVEISGWTLV